MTRPVIGLGFRVGKLTVAEATDGRKNGYTVWRCQCDCGGEILLDTRYLQRGTVRDCGCETVVGPGQRDLTGQRFGKLTALYPTDQRGWAGTVVWRCQCDCGGQIDASLHQLAAGYRKSCGCLSHPPRKEYVGKRFGSLTVLAYAGKRDGMHRWQCKCDCGNEIVVGQVPLQSGRTKSCGCLQRVIYKENLKLINGTSVTMLEAMRGRLIATNTSGCTGVYWDSRKGKWAAKIGFKRKTYYLGTYDRFEDAVKARKRGEELHEDFLAWYYETYPEKAKAAQKETANTK